MLRFIILYCLFVLTFSYKSISICPGGLNGFYSLGICKYIKDNYCLDGYKFYGSSAGSWNALYLSLPLDDDYYFNEINQIKSTKFKDLYHFENNLKQIIFKDKNRQQNNNNIKSLTNCNICFSEFKDYKIEKVIKNRFDDLDDLLECCIASSHLPLITNKKIFYIYQNRKCIDGGLFKQNYPSNIKPNLIISHNMFNNTKILQNKQMLKYSKTENLNIEKLIYEGYKDAMDHCDYFDGTLNSNKY